MDVGLPSPTPASDLMPATSSVLVPLSLMTSEVPSSGVAPPSTWDAIHTCTHTHTYFMTFSSLLSYLPPIIETTEIVSTSIVPPSMPITPSIPSIEDTKVDTFIDELLQNTIKDFFSFLEHCVNVILKGRSIASISNLLNNYIIVIESVGGEEKVAPYKVIMAQLYSNIEALSKTHSTDKSEIIEANFRRLLQEQLKLPEEAQRRKDVQQAHIYEI